MKRREQEEAAVRWARSVLDAATGSAGQEARPSRSGAEERWTAAWMALESPPAATAPAGFSRRVARAWAAERERAAAPLLGAAWMRAAAAAALLAGIALGSTLAYRTDTSAASAASSTGAGADGSWGTTSLSEDYLSALSTPDTDLAAPDGQGADAKATTP